MNNKVDWKLAPDWATVYGVVGVSEMPVFANKRKYMYVGDVITYEFNDNNRSMDAIRLIEYRPNEQEEKPVYTKEFIVGGGKNIPHAWQKCRVLFEGNKYIVVENENGKEFSRKKCKITIRDIETSEERAIDDLEEFLIKNCDGVILEPYNVARVIINFIEGNNVHKIKYTGNK